MTFRLEGTKSNRDGVGASVTVVVGRAAPGRPAHAAAAAISRPTIHGCTSDSATAITSNRSKFAGRRDRSTTGRTWPPIPGICCAKGRQEYCLSMGSNRVRSVPTAVERRERLQRGTRHVVVGDVASHPIESTRRVDARHESIVPTSSNPPARPRQAGFAVLPSEDRSLVDQLKTG